MARRPSLASDCPLAFRKICSHRHAIRDLNLRESEDDQIFFAARKAGAFVMSKDNDFIELLERHGSPPKIIWLTCGNTSEAALKKILSATFEQAMRMLGAGDDLVEIGNQ